MRRGWIYPCNTWQTIHQLDMQGLAQSRPSEPTRRSLLWWLRLSGSLKADAAGRLPMNEKLQTLMYDPHITMHLPPHKKHVRSVETTSVNDPRPTPKKKVKASPKAKSKRPAELKDFDQFDTDGNTICWSFNLSGCKEETKHGRCKKGVHICIQCKRNNHGLGTCRVKKRWQEGTTTIPQEGTPELSGLPSHIASWNLDVTSHNKSTV